MAITAEHIAQEATMLRRYLQARTHLEQDTQREVAVVRDVRTCAHCGERAEFRLDQDGSWYACTACGEFA